MDFPTSFPSSDLSQGVARSGQLLHTNRLWKRTRLDHFRNPGGLWVEPMVQMVLRNRRSRQLHQEMYHSLYTSLLYGPFEARVHRTHFPDSCLLFTQTAALRSSFSLCPSTLMDTEPPAFSPAPLAPTRTLRQPLGRPMDTLVSARLPSGQLNLQALWRCKSRAETVNGAPRRQWRSLAW